MRYYFHLTGAVHHIDEAGFEFADVDEARIQAVRSMGEFVRDQPDLMADEGELRLEVTEGSGQLVFVFVATGVNAV